MSLKNTKITSLSSILPTVVLFGRTNVGKSTLFNKLTEKNLAMVSKIEGTTRDSNAGIVSWRKKKFQLIDTGGLLDTKYLSGKQKLKKIKSETNIDDIDQKVQLQVRHYLKKANLILFLVDNKTGLMEQDRQMALMLKKWNKKNIILVINKVDNPNDRIKSAEFYKLSLGEPALISAANGSGTGDLLDMMTKKLPRSKVLKEPEDTTKIAITGKPNVGKSSLLNAIVGEEKIIVSSIAHTTREPKDLEMQYKDYHFTFIDTAGIVKKKSKVTKNELIKLGILKSLSSIKQADVALLVLDISENISHQDTKITDEILKNKVSLIVIANKWDKIKNKDSKQFTRNITSKLSFVEWAPTIFLSAKNKTKIDHLLELITEVKKSRNQEIDQDELDKFLISAFKHAAPLADKKVRGITKNRIARPKLIKLTQSYVNPPEFTLQIKSKFGLKDNYIKYLENRLRDKFNLIGTPITIKVK